MSIKTKDWLRFGECVEIAASMGVSRKILLKLIAAKTQDPKDRRKEVSVIEQRVFEGCTRRHYGRASLMKVLQTETKP